MKGPRPPIPWAFMRKALRISGRTVEYWLSLGLSLLMIYGFFSSESVSWFLRIGCLVPPLLVGIYRVIRGPDSEKGRGSFFGLSLILIVSANAAIDIPHGWRNELFPVNYLFLSLLAIPLGLPGLVFLSLCPSGIEALSFLRQGTIDEQYQRVLAHVTLSLFFALGVGFLLIRERRQRERVEARQQEMEREARSLTPRASSASQPAELKLLSKESRHLQATKAAYTLEEKLHSILEILKRTIHPYTCILYMMDREGGILRVKDLLSDSDHVTGNAEIRPGEGVLGWVVKEERPLSMSEFNKDITGLPYYTREEGIRSFLAIPVMRNNGVEGVLCVDSREIQAFTEEHSKLLMFASAQILDTIDYMKMSQEMQYEAQEFAAFNNVSTKLSSTLELEEVIPLIIESSREIIPYDLALLALFKPETKTYVIKAVRGGAESPASGGQRSGAEGSEWTGKEFSRESLVGRAIEEYRRVMVFDGLRERERGYPIVGEAIAIESMDSCLCAPFIAREEVLGVLAMFCRKKGGFSDYEAKIIGALANQASVSILNARMYNQMQEMAITDGLTGLLNHRAFQEVLGEEIKREVRHPAPLSLLLTDIDFFKKINDLYGHPIGDQVLKRVARVLSKSIREIDNASRYGGEEFAIVLKNTEKKGAVKMAERIRKAVSDESFQSANGEDFSVTVSIGVACLPEDARGKQELIDRADTALYLAKRKGRNRVEAYSDEMDETTVVRDRDKFSF